MNLPAQNPTRVRYGVLGFACALSMITYLDRVCMGTVMGDMQREFGLSDTERGFIFGALRWRTRFLKYLPAGSETDLAPKRH